MWQEKKRSELRRNELSRRQFLFGGVAGICTLCWSGVSGASAVETDAEVHRPLMAQEGFMRPTRSPWFEAEGNGKLRCKLCPRSCLLAPGERAPCRVRENRDGEGYTLAYGNPALIQEDPVERKPFFHVLPGSRALSVSTAGCNLECEFCEVWDMALVAPEEVYAYDMPPEAVVAHAQEGDVRAISYAFGEPVIFYEYMRDIAEAAREAGFLNPMHTAAYIQPEPLLELAGKLDAVNVDLKSFAPDFYHDIVGGELEPVLETLRLLREADVHIEITTIIIPTLNDDMEMIAEMCEWIVQEMGAAVPMHFARFYPLYKLSSLPRTPVSTLEKARDTALGAGLKFVYIAGVTGHEAEDTYCPGCREVVIEREGFVIDRVHVEEGRCKYCGAEIPGRWD